MIPPSLLIDSVAAFRLTRLVTKDTILRPIRARVIRAAYGNDDDLTDIEWEHRAIGDDEAPRFAELVICYWCAGIWVSAGVLVARRIAPRLWDPVARGLTCAAAAALIAGLEHR